ncbi:MAG: stalk domain-containing protein [Candidatus Cryosericum sp.]
MKKVAALVLLLAVVLSACGVGAGVLTVAAQSSGGWHVLRAFPAGVTAVAAEGPDGPWLAATRAGVYSSSNGEVFTRLSSSLDELKVRTTALLPSGRWFLGTDGDGLWVSVDSGQSWQQDTSLDCVNIAHIRLDRYHQQGLFVASLCHGLYSSTDAGRTWTGMGKGIATFFVTDIVQPSAGVLVVSTRDKGLYRSTDGGISFSALRTPGASYEWLAVDSVKGTLYAAGAGTVIRSTNGGDSWSTVALPAGAAVSGLAVTAQGRLIVGTTSQGVLLSKDLGASFIRLRAGSSSASITTFGIVGGTAFYGSAEGEVGSWTTSESFLSLSTTDVKLGSVPGNQRRAVSLTVTNAGEGTLSWRIENLPSYVTAEPAAGNTTARSTASVSVGPTDMSTKTYQNLVRVTSNGGELFVTIRFEITAPAALQISLTVGSKTALVGGVKMALDAPAFIDAKTGRTFVPIRMISEAFGAQVTWNEAQQKVWLKLDATAQHPSALVVLHIGDRTAQVNGKATTLEAAPRIISGRTFVPLRFVAEAFGATVTWNASARTATIQFMP